MTPISFKRHRFAPEIIQHAVWLYARFTLSLRDVENLLAERGIDVSNETVRHWFLKFGRLIAGNLRVKPPFTGICLVSWAGSGTECGYAVITDGDTFKNDSQRIRPHGVNAPESGQTCQADDAGQGGSLSCIMQVENWP